MRGVLGVHDYHRWHAPVAGRMLEAWTIAGQAYFQIEVRDTSNVEPKYPQPRSQPHGPRINTFINTGL